MCPHSKAEYDSGALSMQHQAKIFLHGIHLVGTKKILYVFTLKKTILLIHFNRKLALPQNTHICPFIYITRKRVRQRGDKGREDDRNRPSNRLKY